MPDPLDSILRLRRLAVSEARRNLASAVGREAQAADDVVVVEQAIAAEARAAADPVLGDAAVEAFGAWLPGAHRRLAAAQVAHDAAVTATAQARAAFNLTQAGLEAAEALDEVRRDEAARLRARAEQSEIDEAARTRPPVP